jgi:hypothetical protein
MENQLNFYEQLSAEAKESQIRFISEKEELVRRLETKVSLTESVQ